MDVAVDIYSWCPSDFKKWGHVIYDCECFCRGVRVDDANWVWMLLNVMFVEMKSESEGGVRIDEQIL